MEGYFLAKHGSVYIFRVLLKVFWCSGMKHHSLFFSDIVEVGTIWFLPALFWSRVSFNLILKWCSKKRYVSSCCMLVALCAGMLDYYIVNLPLAILLGVCALPFYLLGYELKEECTGKLIDKFTDNKNNKITLIVFGVICCFFAVEYSYISMCSCHYRYYPIDFLAGCFGTCVAYIISKGMKNNARLLGWFGRNSLLFYVYIQ